VSTSFPDKLMFYLNVKLQYLCQAFYKHKKINFIHNKNFKSFVINKKELPEYFYLYYLSTQIQEAFQTSLHNDNYISQH